MAFLGRPTGRPVVPASGLFFDPFGRPRLRRVGGCSLGFMRFTSVNRSAYGTNENIISLNLNLFTLTRM